MLDAFCPYCIHKLPMAAPSTWLWQANFLGQCMSCKITWLVFYLHTDIDETTWYSGMGGPVVGTSQPKQQWYVHCSHSVLLQVGSEHTSHGQLAHVGPINRKCELFRACGAQAFHLKLQLLLTSSACMQVLLLQVLCVACRPLDSSHSGGVTA